jgi:acetoin utilization protein AcuB
MTKTNEAKIDSLMATSLITIGSSEPLENALRLLREHGIRHLPVINSGGGVVGILSDRDLLRASVPSPSGYAAKSAELRFVSGATVLDYMSTALKVVPSNGEISQAIDLMLKEKVSSCLVANGNEVVGIVTYEDLLEMLNSYLNRPNGSLRATIGGIVARSPLGTISQVLANSGI